MQDSNMEQQQEQQEAGNQELEQTGDDRISSAEEWEEEHIGTFSVYEEGYFDKDVINNEMSEDERIACNDFLDMNLISRNQDFDEMMRSLSGMDRGIVIFAKSNLTAIMKMWDARRKQEKKGTPKFWEVQGILVAIKERCRMEDERNNHKEMEEICKVLVDRASLAIEGSINSLKGELMTNIESMIMSKRGDIDNVTREHCANCLECIMEERFLTLREDVYKSVVSDDVFFKRMTEWVDHKVKASEETTLFKLNDLRQEFIGMFDTLHINKRSRN